MALTNIQPARVAVQAQLDQVQAQKDACYERMQQLAEVWKEERDACYANGERGKLQLLVRLRKTNIHRSPEASWYRLQNIKTSKGNQPRSEYLKRGVKSQYPPSVFAKCEEWERDIVNFVEPEMMLARQEFAQLLIVEKSLLKLMQIVMQEPSPLFSESVCE